MYSYDIYIDDKSCVLYKIYPVKRPNLETPSKKYREYDILGRNGKLYEDLGLYEDIPLEIEFNYMTSKDLWFETFRQCKKIFLNAKTISFRDDFDFYYKIKKVEIETNQRITKKIGKFIVYFTLDPYSYKKDGLLEHTLTQCLYNQYEVSHPVYKINGEGICHLIVNGTDCECNIGQNLIINTDLMISYKEDGTSQNTAINQNYEDLYLVEGKNTIEITDGFELSIIPNWRCI